MHKQFTLSFHKYPKLESENSPRETIYPYGALFSPKWNEDVMGLTLVAAPSGAPMGRSHLAVQTPGCQRVRHL
jgi:hypothetical protein